MTLSVRVLRLDFLENLVRTPERVVDGRHHGLALKVDHRHRDPRGSLFDTPTPAGIPGRIVGRPQQRRVGVEEGDALLLVPHVVAGGPHLDREHLQLSEDFGSDAESAGDVFDVGDDKVDPFPIHHRLELGEHRSPPRRAHDVADEQESNHRAYSTARVSRMTVTLICPG